MITLLTFIFVISLFFIFYKRKRTDSIQGSPKGGMVSWMEMSSEERRASDNLKIKNSMEKRLLLLEKIRNEYKEVSRKTKKNAKT